MNRTDPELRAAQRHWSVRMDRPAQRLTDKQVLALVQEVSHLIPGGAGPQRVAAAVMAHSGGNTVATRYMEPRYDVQTRRLVDTPRSEWQYGIAGLTISEFGLHVPNGFSRDLFDPASSIAAWCSMMRANPTLLTVVMAHLAQ